MVDGSVEEKEDGEGDRGLDAWGKGAQWCYCCGHGETSDLHGHIRWSARMHTGTLRFLAEKSQNTFGPPQPSSAPLSPASPASHFL